MPTLDATAALLAQAETARSEERLRAALSCAKAVILEETPAPVAAAALDDFLATLTRLGPTALDGGEGRPFASQLEDALLSHLPETPLAESTFRRALVALVSELAKAEGFGGFAEPEALATWQVTAKSRPWPYVDPAGQVAQVVALFGGPSRVVVVRGPGGSAFLAAVRRALFASAGPQALVPPVLSAPRDDLGALLRPWVELAPLEDELREALPRMSYGEDFVGVLGRVGDQTPVALLIDEAKAQARSLLMGLALFREPSAGRRALLVVHAPEDPKQDGALGELIGDARDRSELIELTLPGLTVDVARALLTARFGAAGEGLAEALVEAGPAETPKDKLRCAHEWLEAVADGATPKNNALSLLKAGFDPAPCLPEDPNLVRLLSLAAVEGVTFHPAAVALVTDHARAQVEAALQGDLDRALLLTRELALPTGRERLALHRFSSARLALALAKTLDADTRAKAAGRCRDALFELYLPTFVWPHASTLLSLDAQAFRPRHVEQGLLGLTDAGRAEAGLHRLLPVLGVQRPYRLALARLYGAALEAGTLAASRRQVNEADQAFQAAAQAASRLRRPGPAGEALARLGEMRLALALPQPARQAFDLAKPLLERGGHQASAARLGLLTGEVSVLEGALDQAVVALRGAIQTLRAQGDHAHVALALVRLGRLLYEQGDLEAGASLLDDACHEADASGDPRPAAAARITRAFVHAEQGELDAAFRQLQDAAGAFKAAQMPIHTLEVYAASLQRRHGSPEGALKRLKAVAEIFDRAGASVQWAETFHEVARCLQDMGEHAEAARHLAHLIELRRRARDRFTLVRLHEDLATSAAALGDPVRAFLELSRGQRLAQRLGLVVHQARLDARLAKLAAELPPEATSDSLKLQASTEVDAQEATWRAPIAMAESETPPSVH